jgi:alcohol dehydrogenase YqhD (iron-dependent ADH family)
MEHPLSGYYDIAHGDGLAALLPAWLEALADVRPARLKKMGEQVFGDRDGLSALRNWLQRIDIAWRLRDLGIEQQKLGDLAANALETAPWLARHPKKLDAAAIAAIYRGAW